nr:MAG TPA: hypothetical protein [Caudoviricetes sp.]
MENTDRSVPENGMEQNEVQEEKQEVSSENLFDLVDSGELTLEEANEFIANEREGFPPVPERVQVGKRKNNGADAFLSGMENRESGVYSDAPVPKDGKDKFLEKEDAEEITADGEAAEFAQTPEETGEAQNAGAGEPEEGSAQPFRVFHTQEEYQRVFDNAWNKRYGKMMREQESKNMEYDSLLSDLGDLLGVSKEDAHRELSRRKLMLEAQQRGEEDPESYAAVKAAEAERDGYKAQLDRQVKQAQAREVVANIRRQGAEVSKHDPSFALDSAMENPEFAKIVFSVFSQMPDRAVEVAYRTIYGGTQASDGGQKEPSFTDSAKQFDAQAVRPVEGGVAGRVKAERKPPDFAKMSDKDILDIQNRVLRGEKVEF